MTECNQSSFEFAGPGRRTVVARFDGGTMSSDGGALLLQRTNQKLNLLARAAACFQDRRKPWLVKHQVEEMIAQRVYGLALGYEDLSDHEQLRQDPLLALLSGKQQVGEEPLAGKSTLNRLELSTGQPNRYKKIPCQPEALDELLTAVFVEAHPEPQAPTIRLRLLKVAARIRITTRKVWISLASSYPLQNIFAHAWGQLRC